MARSRLWPAQELTVTRALTALGVPRPSYRGPSDWCGGGRAATGTDLTPAPGGARRSKDLAFSLVEGVSTIRYGRIRPSAAPGGTDARQAAIKDPERIDPRRADRLYAQATAPVLNRAPAIDDLLASSEGSLAHLGGAVRMYPVAKEPACWLAPLAGRGRGLSCCRVGTTVDGATRVGGPAPYATTPGAQGAPPGRPTAPQVPTTVGRGRPRRRPGRSATSDGLTTPAAVVAPEGHYPMRLGPHVDF